MPIFNKENFEINFPTVISAKKELNYPVLIKDIIEVMSYKKYLELGVRGGKTLKYISDFVDFALGVDISDRRRNKETNMYHGTTDEFFQLWPKDKKFDAIFIDADHAYESVKKDFYNSVSILEKCGTIFMHDTDPISKEYLSEDFCNTAYKIVSDIELNGEFDIITFQLYTTGFSLVKRKSDKRILTLI